MKAKKEKEAAKVNPIEEKRKAEALRMAFKEIGGPPSGFSRSSATEIYTNTFRVNIWVESVTPDSCVVKTNKMAHSFVITLPPVEPEKQVVITP